MDPTKLEGEMLKDGECPAKFLHAFQTKWREETGNVWNINDTTKSLFKVMVKKAMPQEVQKRLDNVVGLMKMEWPMFSEHLIHHVETTRKEKMREEEANKHMVNKLTQLQLQELSNSAKQKKNKIQAPVITAEQTIATMAPQGPTGSPPQPQMQTSQTLKQTTPPDMWPPVYIQVNQPGHSVKAHYKGQPWQREGLVQKRSSYRGGREYTPNQNVRTKLQRRQTQNPYENMICWGCNEKGHCRRNCPTNPGIGPAQEWN